MQLDGREANHILAALLLLEGHLQTQNTPKQVRETATFGGVDLMTCEEIDALMVRLDKEFQKERLYGNRTIDAG